MACDQREDESHLLVHFAGKSELHKTSVFGEAVFGYSPWPGTSHPALDVTSAQVIIHCAAAASHAGLPPPSRA